MLAEIFGTIILMCVAIAACIGVWFLFSVTQLSIRQKRKDSGLFALALVGLVSLSACTRIEPGSVGIAVENLGSDKGVQDYVLKTGLVGFIPIMTTIYEYPTYTQTVKYEERESLNFNSKEGTVFRAAMSVSYSLRADKVPSFYVKFRNDDLSTFTHGFFKNVVRSSLNSVAEKYTAEEVYSLRKEEIIAAALQKINEEVEQYGIVVEQFGFLSAPTPPDQVIEAINAKTTAIQQAIRVENELRTAQAEAQKMIAQARGQAESLVTRAKGEAEANMKVSQSLTPLLVKKMAIEKWNGAQPSVMTGGGSELLLNMGSKE